MSQRGLPNQSVASSPVSSRGTITESNTQRRTCGATHALLSCHAPQVVHALAVHRVRDVDAVIPRLGTGAAPCVRDPLRVQYQVPCRSPKGHVVDADEVRPRKVVDSTLRVSNALHALKRVSSTPSPLNRRICPHAFPLLPQRFAIVPCARQRAGARSGTVLASTQRRTGTGPGLGRRRASG